MLILKQNKFPALLPLFFCLFCFSLSKAQTPLQTENPYSRYGLGELEKNTFTPLSAMGSAGTAFENDTLAPVFINPSNPASYASLRITAFEAGLKSNFNFLSTETEKSYKNNTYLHYISFGFPLGKRTGIAAGISPYSSVGYKIVDAYTVNGIGDMKTEYEGSGGVNQVFAGLGWKPFKNSYSRFRKSRMYDSLARAGRWDIIRSKRILKSTLSSFSLGANGYFMFGDLDQKTDVVYPSHVTYFSTRRIRSTRISDFYSSYGAMFTIRLDSTLKKRKCLIPDTSAKDGVRIEYHNECPCKSSMTAEEYEKQFPKKYQRGSKKDTKITFASTAYLPMNLDARYSALAYTYKKYSATQDYTYDTTLNISSGGTITMPLILNFGVSVKRGNSLTLLGDVSLQNWSLYRYLGENPNLKNSTRFSLGFQYIDNSELKDVKGRDLLAKKTSFRGGLYYEKSYLDLKNSQIASYGLTLGAGIPLGKRIFNQINTSAEFGTWGTKENNLIQNNYIRLKLGFTFNDRWFIKRVID